MTTEVEQANIENLFEPEAIKIEVSKLSPVEMVAELVQWRTAVPNIAHMTNELSRFKQFAVDPDELAEKINRLSASYTGALELKDKQIEQLMLLIKQYQVDPIGVGKHIEELANSKIKLN